VAVFQTSEAERENEKHLQQDLDIPRTASPKTAKKNV